MIAFGSIPALFLPETLEDAKAKRSIIQNDSNGSPGETEPSTANTAMQELIRQMREFKQSTQFIWHDSNVYLMIVVLFVTIISKQSTNILLQYASKKFEWSLARVRILADPQVPFINKSQGHPSHLAARHCRHRKFPAADASSVLGRRPVLWHPWEISGSSHEPGSGHSLCNRVRRHGPCTERRSSYIRPSHLIPGLCVPHHLTESRHSACTPRPRRNAIFSHCDLRVYRPIHRRSVIRIPLPAGYASRQCLDGSALSPSSALLRGCHGGCLAHPDAPISIRRRGGSSLILIDSEYSNKGRTAHSQNRESIDLKA